MLCPIPSFAGKDTFGSGLQVKLTGTARVPRVPCEETFQTIEHFSKDDISIIQWVLERTGDAGGAGWWYCQKGGAHHTRGGGITNP